MTDPVVVPPKAATNWADVVQTALHYVAAGALIGAIGYFAYAGKVAPETFTNLCVAALAGLGVYQGTKS